MILQLVTLLSLSSSPPPSSSSSSSVITCLTVVRAQFPEVDAGAIQERTRPHGRFVPRPTSRSSGGQFQPIISHQRIRRPIPIKSKSPVDTNEFSAPTAARPRPNLLPAVKPIENPTTTPSPPSSQSLQQDQPTKPVSEETKEEEEEISPQPLVKIGPLGPPFFQPHNNFVSNNNPITPKSIQFRPSQAAPLTPVFTRQSQLLDENIAPIQYRPPKPVKYRKPVEELPEIRNPVKHQQQPQYHQHQQQPQYHQHQHHQQQQPKQPQQQPQSLIRQSGKKATSYREKKPVAQIIRRWREDNDDGSITWGFENDDGSYKEEIIGIDCVTRGKYGYVDPDGIRREYTYETGIKCDEEEQQDDEDNGFVDYQENKLVLPNGKTIDLSSMGKKQTRRPQPIYRN
ncbi:hypothetical protein PV325_005532 [Microctonus aethiopoides]|uniref:Uncharacterized protein n=1 Tax=Microctonus aethiopoides TaxID=144406 RepID=A0AA39F769_9HYME|nr:hypothetical protein PV325_005532 [Microctonus aethiopoides]KAK0164220.1 hypothetical protein PV328_002873 [Microctonus aethiopoides]